jgi:hypothetical protein
MYTNLYEERLSLTEAGIRLDVHRPVQREVVSYRGWYQVRCTQTCMRRGCLSPRLVSGWMYTDLYKERLSLPEAGIRLDVHRPARGEVASY